MWAKFVISDVTFKTHPVQVFMLIKFVSYDHVCLRHSGVGEAFRILSSMKFGDTECYAFI